MPQPNKLPKFSKSTFLQKCLYFLALLIIIILLRNTFGNKQEGFTAKGGENNVANDGSADIFALKTDTLDIYDDFYSKFYDILVYSKNKNKYEIDNIIKTVKPKNGCKCLDIGCGTGHHVNELSSKGLNVTGIDISPSMIKMSKTNYPDRDFKIGDALHSDLFIPESFGLITCFYHTIYYFMDKRTLLSNCYNWLIPGGFLIINMVNRDKFDPMIPTGSPFSLVSPQKYTKKRIMESIVQFTDYEYKAKFDLKDTVNTANDPNATMTETFTNKKNGHIRKNQHNLYMDSQANVLDIAKKLGFIIYSKYELTECNYEYTYIYILEKPN